MRFTHFLKHYQNMLNRNRASVLFGATGSYVMNGDCMAGQVDASGDLASWSAGITVGYEYRIVKCLQVMCRIRKGVKEAVKSCSLSKLLRNSFVCMGNK